MIFTDLIASLFFLTAKNAKEGRKGRKLATLFFLTESTEGTEEDCFFGRKDFWKPSLYRLLLHHAS